MGKGKNNSRGFTLIAALLIMVLLSGVAAGLLYLVTNESKMGGNDLEANLAYYGAESGMEKLTSDLAALYNQYQTPTNAQIQNLINYPPTSAMVSGMNYTETISYPLVNGSPQSSYNTVSSGSNQGLYAEIVPMTLQVIALRPGGATANITRKVEVALIPVFQFGVFCGYDCSYFAGPNFSFGGRVHTNQNLFLAAGGDLVFNDKVSAYQQIVMDQLENGNPTTNGYGGTVYVPKASSGCPLNSFPPTGTNCKALPGAGTVPGDASWSGGYPSVSGSTNPNFPSISSGTLNGFLTNSLTGATNMELPFVKNSCTSNPPPCTDPIAIIRKPQPGEGVSSTLGSSRLYNKAQIRILLADTVADLHPERGTGALDSQDVELPNATSYSTAPFSNATLAVSGAPGGVEAMGFATAGSNGWVTPYTDSGAQTGWTTWPLTGELTTNPSSPSAMTGPWIRVEYYNGTAWVGVTKEWLGLGVGQPFNVVPITPNSNTVNPNAILILQQLRPGLTVTAANVSGTGNWYPINFYDAREGEMRDNAVSNYTSGNNTYSSCSVNGIMNAVELDVGNLARWLNGTMGGGTTGSNVNYTNENGYVLYFSDHRGMLASTHPSNGGQTPAGVINGESGIEDVINSSKNLTSTQTDGVLEGATYYSYSPEDVDQNGFLDNWGEKNIGYGFGLNTNTSPYDPYVRVPNATVTNATQNCATVNTSTGTFAMSANNQVGMANMVSGARHVLKLVDAGMSAGLQSYLPVMPAASGCAQSAANPTGCGGFTVVSENPVYVQGDYNTNSSDPFWGTANNATPTQTSHSAASIIADAVTLLSDQWTDANSMVYPDISGNRKPTQDAYYRTAISGGKNIPFPQPTWTNAAQDLGTDGGMHNFLRYLENLGNITLHYDGSLVSMYYAEYDTGIYKDGPGGTVYSPPTRNYYFDVLFLNPANLPPATPEFQDVVNLSYHQNFTPQ
ncbi:MAG TPA: PilX N-terminal domain-containing pilus assembly protein [Verrucomicrobiae bacterium]|nr:PilX N-terminal domain-containing pilus assembly protein [Verrucomicrobiae bacterium]